MIEQVPNEFKVLTNHEYPPHNKMIFEEYFMNYYMANPVETDFVYLPILWTNFYISRKYGTVDMSDLQNYLNKLDRNKKYFTIIQYDDGILQNIEGLDLLIFGAGGGGKKTVSERNLGYPIPLLCQSSLVTIRKKDILCSFVGQMKNHSIRRKLLGIYNSEFVIKDCIGYDYFINILEKSIFSLCPRGYGATSFRICESLQHGSIPIYVYDKPWIPFKDEFDFNEIGILISEEEIPNILNIVKNKTKEDIQQYLSNGEKIYKEYFTFEGCTHQIINKL